VEPKNPSGLENSPIEQIALTVPISDNPSLAPEFHFPNVDSRKPSMCAPLRPKPILLVSQRASDCDINLGSNCGGFAWPLDGVDFNGDSVLQGTEVGVHAESRSVQHEGARADHHL
jgi:hypothetical protein